MPDIVIFGTGDNAEQAHYYLKTDSPHRIAAFCLTGDRIKEDSFIGLPVVPFEEVEQAFPADRNRFFAPMSGRRMNRDRQQFYGRIKDKGYELISYVSSRATICDNQIGENCFILEGTNIQPFTRIGNNTIIWCSSHVGHHSRIGDHVFISSGVVVSGRCSIDDNCYVSANVVIDANTSLAAGTLAGLGSTISRDTEAWGVYLGQPARKRKMKSTDFEFLK